MRKIAEGLDSVITSSLMTTSGKSKLKDHKRFILNQSIGGVRIEYNMNLGDIQGVSYTLIVQLAENPDDKRENIIAYEAPDTEDGSIIVFITLLNWTIRGVPSKFTDVVTAFKKFIDCGNGVGLYFQLGIKGSVISNSFDVDLYIWANIDDENLIMIKAPDTADEEKDNVTPIEKKECKESSTKDDNKENEK